MDESRGWSLGGIYSTIEPHDLLSLLGLACSVHLVCIYPLPVTSKETLVDVLIPARQRQAKTQTWSSISGKGGLCTRHT